MIIASVREVSQSLQIVWSWWFSTAWRKTFNFLSFRLNVINLGLTWFSCYSSLDTSTRKYCLSKSQKLLPLKFIHRISQKSIFDLLKSVFSAEKKNNISNTFSWSTFWHFAKSVIRCFVPSTFPLPVPSSDNNEHKHDNLRVWL